MLTLGIYALATVHGIGSGSDTLTVWGLGIYLLSSVVVSVLLCRRIVFTLRKRKAVLTSAAAAEYNRVFAADKQRRIQNKASVRGMNRRKRVDQSLPV